MTKAYSMIEDIILLNCENTVHFLVQTLRFSIISEVNFIFLQYYESLTNNILIAYIIILKDQINLNTSEMIKFLF